MFSLRSAIFVPALDRSDAGSRANRLPSWRTRLATGLLVGLAVVVIVPLIPAIDAHVPDEHAGTRRGIVQDLPREAGASIPQADVAAIASAAKRRNRGNCPECGVIEAIRKSGRSGDAGRKGMGDLELTIAETRRGKAVVGSNEDAALDFEITVRFRDGARMVLNEASPRDWRAGSRVIVIGRTVAVND